ncbi:rab11 family-interacting protein 4B isoform X4 [Culicoides brevitarsis]|uniref:rab11 family-interacting protein 4B isoform X4 n=1 Tax=Culicoides brevitarsis TaxID=469753 RepID=UPI00307B9741
MVVSPYKASRSQIASATPIFQLRLNDTINVDSTMDNKRPSTEIASSSGESFEGFGENEQSELDLAPEMNHTVIGIGDGERNTLSRNSWSRTSLRGSNPRNNTSYDALPNRRWGSMRHSGKRQQLSSNALASFNSSGRSSNCDTTEDVYSDLSLEDVQDLNHKLEILQRQVTNLADTQNNVDDIKSRTKADYAVLQARYHMLEEQLRDTELRAEERLAEEQKRHRELLNRAERETNLLQENCEIRIRTVEQEKNNVRDELQRLRMQMEKQTLEMQNMEDKLEKTRDNLMNIQQDLVETKASNKRYREEKATTELILKEMETELTLLRQENQERRRSTASNNNNEDIRFEELTRELSELKDQNRQLQEANEELQAMMLTRGVEQGINLLNGTSASLAKELEAMGQQQDTIDSATLESLSQLQEAYKDKEEENKRLKHYIDTILLNIVENYPQLLEVKSAAP